MLKRVVANSGHVNLRVDKIVGWPTVVTELDPGIDLRIRQVVVDALLVYPLRKGSDHAGVVNHGLNLHIVDHRREVDLSRLSAFRILEYQLEFLNRS